MKVYSIGTPEPNPNDSVSPWRVPIWFEDGSGQNNMGYAKGVTPEAAVSEAQEMVSMLEKEGRQTRQKRALVRTSPAGSQDSDLRAYLEKYKLTQWFMPTGDGRRFMNGYYETLLANALNAIAEEELGLPIPTGGGAVYQNLDAAITHVLSQPYGSYYLGYDGEGSGIYDGANYDGAKAPVTSAKRAQEDDGTSGQDRDSYSDDQDREDYTVDPELDIAQQDELRRQQTDAEQEAYKGVPAYENSYREPTASFIYDGYDIAIHVGHTSSEIEATNFATGRVARTKVPTTSVAAARDFAFDFINEQGHRLAQEIYDTDFLPLGSKFTYNGAELTVTQRTEDYIVAQTNDTPPLYLEGNVLDFRDQFSLGRIKVAQTNVCVECGQPIESLTEFPSPDGKGLSCLPCYEKRMEGASWATQFGLSSDEVLDALRSKNAQADFAVPSVEDVTSAEQATDLAISWQHWMSEQNLGMDEFGYWEDYFAQLAVKFPELREEFIENAIIGGEEEVLGSRKKAQETPCNWCQGQGVVDGDVNNPCKVCGGTGVLVKDSIKTAFNADEVADFDADYALSIGSPYVGVYDVSSHYGGPEEGGWWYDRARHIKSFPVAGMTVDKLRAILSGMSGETTTLPPSHFEGDDDFMPGEMGIWDSDLQWWYEKRPGDGDDTNQPRPHYE